MKHASKHLKVLARVDILPIHLVIYHSLLSKIVKQSIEKVPSLYKLLFFHWLDYVSYILLSMVAQKF